MKFRKKPIIVEAKQFCLMDVPEGVVVYQHLVGSDETTDTTRYELRAYIDTLEGRMNVNIGDWIITGIRGEKYACKSGIFEATYEKVEE